MATETATQSLEGALLVAAKSGYVDDCQTLLQDARTNVNERDKLGNTPLIVAAAAGHFQVVAVLLQNAKVDVNAQNNVGETALHRVCGGRRVCSFALSMARRWTLR